MMNYLCRYLKLLSDRCVFLNVRYIFIFIFVEGEGKQKEGIGKIVILFATPHGLYSHCML